MKRTSFCITLIFLSCFFIFRVNAQNVTDPTVAIHENGCLITWQPQLAKFEITQFDDFGIITKTKSVNLTISCVEGSGSGSVSLTKTPSDVGISFVPTFGTPSMEAGETYSTLVTVSNLGTSVTRDFTLTATVTDSLGSVTDTANVTGTILMRTGAQTLLNVMTKCNGKAINGLTVKIEYYDYSQSGITGSNGEGTVQFDLETSADTTTKVYFEGNEVYESASTTIALTGGSEETITFNLDRLGDSTEDGEGNWEMVILVLGLATLIVIFGIFYMKKTRTER